MYSIDHQVSTLAGHSQTASIFSNENGMMFCEFFFQVSNDNKESAV
jgi:hypothetical protein